MQYVYLAASDATYPTGHSAAASAFIDAAWQRCQDDESWWCEPWQAESAAQAHLLRDIVGNPFRQVRFVPNWRSPVVTTLADLIYAERVFDRMPILADALEEAGCDDPDILAHCRGDGPHVRGCWVVDLVLGRG